ncbi:MAG TPA: DUF507 family protein [Vicinamibacteria bacterium]|nr:DUF507 family protein [Vicinamibacteria bacterium]
MRLTKNQIEFISYRITKELLEKGYIEIDHPSNMVQKLVGLMTEELLVEDRLNDEVREILTEHSEEMRRTNVEYREMFKMIKKKLARERKIIL